MTTYDEQQIRQMYEHDPNRLGNKASRKRVKEHELSLIPEPLAVCFVCGVVFHDRADTNAEPYWFTECPAHRNGAA